MTDRPEALTDDSDMEDLDASSGLDLVQLDLSLLRSPVVTRALAIIAIATMVLIWPQRTDRILARLIGVGLLALASTGIWGALRARPRRFIAAGIWLIGGAVAVFLVVSPDRSETFLARLVGIAIVVTAVQNLAEARRAGGTEPQTWTIARTIAMLATGALLVVFPGDVFAALTTIVALGWIALSFVVIGISLDARTRGTTDYTDSMRLIGTWLEDRPKSVDDRQALYAKILYEGPATSHRIVRFFTLMAFASVIASMGVITDSTAVVIGAMLIAPLMTPLMGMAISLVMGWPHRLARSSLVAVAGIGVAIGIGVLLGLIAPTVLDTASNSQIVARATPTTLDLITALAAGAAGAYGLSRPDVSDSLPGVAIAISLVPPLTVVGIAYSQADWTAGNGALLLFMTNMLAILIMGGLTFIATGVTPLRRAAENQHRVRTSIAAVGTLAAIVLGALLLNGAQVTSNLFEQSTTETAVARWLDDHPQHTLVQVDVDGDVVTATIVGPSTDRPDAAALAGDLQTALGRPVTADVRLIVEEREVAGGG